MRYCGNSAAKIIPQIDERLAGIEYGRAGADYYTAAGCPARPRCRILPLRHYFECVAVVTFAGAGEFYAPSAALEEPDAHLRFERVYSFKRRRRRYEARLGRAVNAAALRRGYKDF